MKGIVITSRVSASYALTSESDTDVNLRELQNPFLYYRACYILPLTISQQMNLAELRGINEFSAFMDVLKERTYHALVRSPFLLTMMIEQYRRNDSEFLNAVRPTLYSSAVRGLLYNYLKNKSLHHRDNFDIDQKLDDIVEFLSFMGQQVCYSCVFNTNKFHLASRV